MIANTDVLHTKKLLIQFLSHSAEIRKYTFKLRTFPSIVLGHCSAPRLTGSHGERFRASRGLFGIAVQLKTHASFTVPPVAHD